MSALKRQLYDTIIHPFLMEAGGKNRHLVSRVLRCRAAWCLRETIRIAWCVFWLALWEYVRRDWGGIVKGENDGTPAHVPDSFVGR